MILETCKYFEGTGNFCSRVTAMRCDEFPECEFKYIAELKAENDRLKEDYIKLSQQKDLDNARWQKRCTDLHIEDKAKADKYWLVLQEIKAIAKGIRGYLEVPASRDVRYEMDRILSLITKAEEE